MILFIIIIDSSPSGGFGSTIRAILLTNIAHAGMINKRLSRACIEYSRISNRDEIFSLLVMAKYFQRLSMTTKIPWLTTPLILTSAFVFVFFTSLKLADPPVSFDDGDPMKAMLYENGRPVKTVSIKPKSKAHETVRGSIDRRRGLWRRSYATYVPEVYVKSANFNVNYQKNRIIINYFDKKGRRSQAVADITADEFQSIKKAVSSSVDKE